ncbi:DoxX family protein [Microbacterium hominis]|uniref:DoxX family protein n=1 Tax=Microbacterium hominis TaxID=162426 RepID=A0A7D4PV46_9MICO|nr:DoxX family protein [Microbacterium hominis]QKJ19494.1 DoxX family protein [Microbacterium hominis]
MTTVPLSGGTAGVVRPVRPSITGLVTASLALERRAEASVKAVLQRWSVPALRVALGTVFAVFGALKLIPGASPVEQLVMQTWEKLTFGLVGGQAAMIATAAIEVAAGVLLILGGAFARVGLIVVAFAFVGILSPIVLLPQEVFGAAGPTLTGQYIFKNVVLIAAVLVVASAALRGPRDARD